MKNFNWKDLLGQHSLFEGLDPKEVERIIVQLLDDKVSDEREYAEGNIIVREGELGASVFLVGRGAVQVVLEGDNGAGTPIATLRQGEFFGEMALLEKKPRAATVKARESCILLEIKGQEFLKLLDEHKDVESKMLLKLSERLRHANDQVLAGRVRGVDEKLEALKTKLEAEVKAVDAQFKAALAVFDQTKIRTDEIINSAERNRTRLTSVLTVISVVIGLFGWLGFKEILDIRKERESIATLAGEAKKDAESIRDAKKTAKAVDDELGKLKLLIHQNARNLLLPAFYDGLQKRSADAFKYYDQLRQINPANLTFDLVLQIANEISKQANEIAKQPKQESGYYSNLLEAILEDANTPTEKTLCYYTLVASHILANDRNKFDMTFSDFKKNIARFKDWKIEKKELSILESILNEVFSKQSQEKQKMFQLVKEQVVRL